MFDLPDIDYEAAELKVLARRAAKLDACQCGNDLPGTCPGPNNCPYSGVGDVDEEK